LGVRGIIVRIKPGIHNYGNYPELIEFVSNNKNMSIIASTDLPVKKSVEIPETMSSRGKSYTEPELDDANLKRRRPKKDKVSDGNDSNPI